MTGIKRILVPDSMAEVCNLLRTLCRLPPDGDLRVQSHDGEDHRPKAQA